MNVEPEWEKRKGPWGRREGKKLPRKRTRGSEEGPSRGGGGW